MSLKLEVIEARNRDEIVGAFRAARIKGVQAVNVLASPILSQLFLDILMPQRSIGFQPSINGRSTPTPGGSSPMDHRLWPCGGKAIADCRHYHLHEKTLNSLIGM